MMTRKTFVMLTLAVAVTGLAGSAFVGRKIHEASAPQRFTHAAWKHVFDAPSELALGVDVVALARAVSTRAGRVAVSDNGEDSLPFEEVTFEIIRGMKGARTGEPLVVERAGGTDYEGQAVLLDADGGPFEVGATYLLFLKRQEDGPFYYQVNDQGRYRIVDDHLFAVTEEDDVAAFFHGRPLADGMRLIGEYLRANPPRGRPAETQ